MSETINHPPHYGGDTIYEVIKVIEAWGLGFCLGNAVKYIGRAPHKGSQLEDLKKARWYLDREIRAIERNRDIVNASVKAAEMDTLGPIAELAGRIEKRIVDGPRGVPWSP